VKGPEQARKTQIATFVFRKKGLHRPTRFDTPRGMFSSPLLVADRTWLPTRWREWAGRHLSGPPPGPVQRRFAGAIFQVDRLGDFVLALSVIRKLLAAWGEERSLLVVSSAAASLASLEFPRTPRVILPVDAPSLTRNLVPIWWRHRRKLRGTFCERVVCLSHHRDLYKSVVLSWIATARMEKLDDTTFPATASDSQCRELAAHRKLVGDSLGWPLTQEEILPRLKSISPRDGEDLLVCPFASESVRQMPRPLLLAALSQWRARSKAPITFCSSARDAGAVQQLIDDAQREGLGPLNVPMTGSFEPFLAAIANAGAVLAVESGHSHLATALDKRACIVMGGGAYGWAAPWRLSDRQVMLHERVPCYGCGWRCNEPEVYCLTKIPPAAIAAALPAL
jgi:ADP-heptose:LPS heptosyltransferase